METVERGRRSIARAAMPGPAKYRQIPGGESLESTREVSAAYCPAREDTGHSASGHACLLVWECTLVCGLLLLWKVLSEARRWPPGWAQPCGQRSLLTGGMCRGPSKGLWAGSRPRGNTEPCCRGRARAGDLWQQVPAGGGPGAASGPRGAARPHAQHPAGVC